MHHENAEGDTPPPDHGTSVTHVYGLISLVPSLVGLILAFNQSTDLSHWLLLASGWVASIFLAVFLVHMSKQFSKEIATTRTRARSDGFKIGKLEERVEDLAAQIDRRHATLDYLSGLLARISSEVKQPEATRYTGRTEREGSAK